MERLPENCIDVQGLLPLWVGSDLEPHELDAVRSHLKECNECRALADRGQAARAVFMTLREEEEETSAASPELWQGIRSRLLEEGVLGPADSHAQRELASVGPRVSRSWGRWGGVAAAAALVITLGVVRLLEPSTELEPTNPIAAEPAMQQPVEAVDLEATVLRPAVALRRAAADDEHMIDQAATYRGGWDVTTPVPQGTGDGTQLTSGGQPVQGQPAQPRLRRRRIR